MLGIPWEVTEHALRLILGSKPAKQCLRHFDDERHRAIGEEIAKLPRLGESSIPAVPDCNKPTSSMAFHLLEETKMVGVNPTDSAKMVRIGTQLPAK